MREIAIFAALFSIPIGLGIYARLTERRDARAKRLRIAKAA